MSICKIFIQSTQFFVFTVILSLFVLNSCTKTKEEKGWETSEKSMDQLIVERVFSWPVSRNVKLTVEAIDNNDNPLPFVRFNIYTESPANGGLLMFSGTTNSDGIFETVQSLPLWKNQITIVTTNLELKTEKVIPMEGQVIHILFEGLIPDTVSSDIDGDGVTDPFDDYPQDTLKSFNNYCPNEMEFGYLVFEDSWPDAGDNDFNDMVVGYRFNLITNFLNQVVQVKVTLVVEAIGTIKHNGFGFQLYLDTNLLTRVNGARLKPGFISVDDKGFETGQQKAVVIAFDDACNLFLPSKDGTVTNTLPGNPFISPDTVVLTIDLKNPIPVAGFGLPPYNPFLFIDGDRKREVHLPDFPPTDQADTSLFGTLSDNSKPEFFRYYKSRNNLPWALHLPGHFRYLEEGAVINKAYMKFNDWAESTGVLFQDWYWNTSGGYRNNDLIYSH